MAHSVRDLELFCRVIFEYEPWNVDFKTLHMPWNSSLAQRESEEKLVISMFTDDGVVASYPPIIEGLLQVRNALIVTGHEVIELEPMSHQEANEVVSRLYLLKIRSHVEAKKHGTWSLAESWEMNIKRDKLRAQALKHWNETSRRTQSGRPADAVLCPASATLAPPCWKMQWFGYTAYWNLLDLPSAVFPLGKLFDASQCKSVNHSAHARPRNSIEEFVTNQWDPDTYDGVPMALQLVGRQWQEEKLIAELRVVDRVIARLG
ncbi:hypothetical protein OPQ81_011271 [Rhizoctonia solani]|nr:hypothetical protein OPQ81_011271 [Rhizoctonia solani]